MKFDVPSLDIGSPKLDRALCGRGPLLRLRDGFVGRDDGRRIAQGIGLARDQVSPRRLHVRAQDLVAMAETIFALDARHARDRRVVRDDIALELSVEGGAPSSEQSVRQERVCSSTLDVVRSDADDRTDLPEASPVRPPRCVIRVIGASVDDDLTDFAGLA